MLTCPLNIFFLLIIGAKVQSICLIDSGGGSVGRVDASSTRDPQYESLHGQNFINKMYNQITEKTKIKKRPGMAHL